MEKFQLSKAHIEKRRKKSKFVLRQDIFGSYLQRELSPKDYFKLSFAFPDEVDKVIIDGLYDGDFYSVYDSEVLPLRRDKMFARFRNDGIDIFGEWVKHVKGKGKECWVTSRISEVEFKEGAKANPRTIEQEHPDWFIPAFGYKMINMAIPQMRELKLKAHAELMRKYEFDGLDIDFERHTPILPPGKQWEMRECITDFMRKLRADMLEIEKETGRVVMLSARVPDCLDGCREDGLDVEQWIREDLVDCITMGSRSFDIKIEEVKALSDEIQVYAGYDTHHTVDGYTFPSLQVLRGVWYANLARGADAIEYFNWMGEGSEELIALVKQLTFEYGMDPARECFVEHANDDFTGVNDKEFLLKQDKTYVIDRRGGYPWGIGYGNHNNTRQLPLCIENEGVARLYIGEDISKAKSATLNLLFEELKELPEIYFNGKKLECTSAPHRDMQVTGEKEAPISGYGVTIRLLNGIDISKPCTMLIADVTGMETAVGYSEIKVVSKTAISLEKVELEVKES